VKGVVVQLPVHLRSVAVVVIAVLLSNVAPASADPINFNQPIQNNVNLKCLEPVGESMDPGAAIVQVTCETVPGGDLTAQLRIRAQDWGLVALGDNKYRLLNHLSGLCIDARGDAVNETPVVQWPCATISNQTWETGQRLPGVASLISRVSGTSNHCLDVPGGQPTDSLPLQIYVCNGTSAQAWRIGV
jgi:Ricin-type beta-trefoil lectin domain